MSQAAHIPEPEREPPARGAAELFRQREMAPRRLNWPGLAPAAGASLQRWATSRLSRSPLAHAAALGLVHAAVDASTVTAVFRTTRAIEMSRASAFWIVVAYNLIAFGLQPAVGWISDRWRLPRACLLLGIVLPALALFTPSTSAVVTLACAALGNALFHVGAGVLVLGHGLEKTAPAGVFVGPGALGLGFGIWYGRNPGLGPAWPLAIALGLALGAWVLLRRRPAEHAGDAPAARAGVRPVVDPGDVPRARGAAGRPASQWIAVAVALLLVSVAVRSLVGGEVTRGCPRSLLLLLGVPLAAFAGKSLGGFIADRIGWLEATGLALLTSTPLIVWGAGHTPLLLLGMLLFQTTMPVTLIAVARALPRFPGVAFGLPCLALVLGSLPALFPGIAPALQRPQLLGWAALALASVITGLWLLGLRPAHVFSFTKEKRITT